MMNQYTNLESLQAIYSDVYKDAYGIRPRWAIESSLWNDEAALSAEIDRLADVANAEYEAELAYEAQVAAQLAAAIEATRPQALRVSLFDLARAQS